MITLMDWYQDYSAWVIKFVIKNLQEGLLEGESLEAWDSDFVDYINESTETEEEEEKEEND